MAAQDAGMVLGYMKRPSNKQNEKGAPGKIRCFANGEWKDRSEFSGRQLEKYQRSGATPRNSRISCREHTTQVRRELKCEGPCGEWYPIENFSRSTRSHSKTWCTHCTEWQLSVEPGYAPFNPPGLVEDDEENAEEGQRPEGGSVQLTSRDVSDRIVDWIEQSPSEDGDFEAAATSTMVGNGLRSSVVAPVPSLLDSPSTELDLLPVALSAANASSTANGAHSRPSYASVASTNADAEMLPGLFDRQMGSGTGPASGRGVGSTQQPHDPPAPGSVSSENTTRAPSQNHLAVIVPGTTWVEDEFAALAIFDGGDPLTASGWARPNGRRTDLVTPRYVANSRGTDNQPLSTQRVTYAEEDDDDSGDEC